MRKPNPNVQEARSRLVAAGVMPERNYFAEPVIAESKQAFLSYCQEVLDIDAKAVGKIVKEHFGGEVNKWDGPTALEALRTVYEAFGAVNKKLSYTYWATPSKCPLCGNQVQETQLGQGLTFIMSKPYHRPWQCIEGGKITARTHHTWPLMSQIAQIQKGVKHESE